VGLLSPLPPRRPPRVKPVRCIWCRYVYYPALMEHLGDGVWACRDEKRCAGNIATRARLDAKGKTV